MLDPDARTEARERFKPEYTVVEALIACLIDGIAPRAEVTRKQRVRRANKAITNIDIDRLDEPDSPITRALFEMQRIQESNYLTTLLPEFGGTGEPVRDLENDQPLAIKACEAVGLKPGGNEEKLRKRYAGTYFKKLNSKDSVLAAEIPWIMYNGFDAAGEQALLDDFRLIQSVLAKHGVSMKLDNVFWRSIGKIKESVTKT